MNSGIVLNRRSGGVEEEGVDFEVALSSSDEGSELRSCPSLVGLQSENGEIDRDELSVKWDSEKEENSGSELSDEEGNFSLDNLILKELNDLEYLIGQLLIIISRRC